MKKCTAVFFLFNLIFLMSCNKGDQFSKEAPLLIETSSVLKEQVSNIEIAEQQPGAAIYLSKDFEQRIAEIVKPAKEALMTVLEKDETGSFKAYQEEIAATVKLDSPEDQTMRLEAIKERYYGFFINAWKQAGIDESLYKDAIVKSLPEALRDKVEFEPEFLGFVINSSVQRPRYDPSGVNDPETPAKPIPKPDPQPQPNPPAPPQKDYKCYDGVAHFFEKPHTSAVLGSSAFTSIGNFNKTVSASALSMFAGWAIAENIAVTDISIPGTFTADGTILRITKQYLWAGRTTAFSMGATSVAVATGSSHRGMIDRAIITVAPVIWYVERNFSERLSYDELVSKTSTDDVNFGASAFASSNVLPAISAVASASATVRMDSWQICEIPTINF